MTIRFMIVNGDYAKGNAGQAKKILLVWKPSATGGAVHSGNRGT